MTQTKAQSVAGVEPDESVIAAYEQALRHGPAPALADFVPPRAAPHRVRDDGPR